MVWISRAMESILFTASLLIICLSVDVKGSLQPDEHSSSRFESTSTNCTAPKPPVSGAMLKWEAERDSSVFVPGEKAEFVCMEGFRQIGWLKTLTCQNDGNWSSKSSVRNDFTSSESASGSCVTNLCNDSGIFHCKTNNKPVDICKRCDCVADCQDGSDEMNCGPILINVTGKATGEIKYTENTKTRYTGPARCSKILWTDDPSFYVKLLFTNFSFSGDCDDNYIFLNNATFRDTEASYDCCKKSAKVACGFGAKSGAPPLSHTAKNFMIVTVVSKEANSSEFTANWFNVNGLFPYGVVPKDDPPYQDNFKLDKTQNKNIDKDATDSTYVAAVVIFSIFAFVILAIVACKAGQHFIGPQCSVGYCCAWIAAKRNRRSPRQAPSPEATPIRGGNNDEHAQGTRSQRTVVVNDGSSNLRTRYGSAEETA